MYNIQCKSFSRNRSWNWTERKSDETKTKRKKHTPDMRNLIYIQIFDTLLHQSKWNEMNGIIWPKRKKEKIIFVVFFDVVAIKYNSLSKECGLAEKQ